MSASPFRRYLVPFDPRRSLHRFVDVLILGGGLTGLRAALACDPALEVLVVTKDQLAESNSSYAQGGVASVIDPEDRIEWHVRDTLIAGADLCDLAAVEMVVQQGPESIRELIAWGTQFDVQRDQLALGREGGHSHNRIVHALGDATGQEIMRAVIAKARAQSHVEIIERAFTLDLLTQGNRCSGAVIFHRDQMQLVWAKQTILATGGAGQLYRETTNPLVATADGHAMAIRAGVAVRDMEFMQFHPTVLYIAGGSRSLITEAVRGEGAYLIDREGHRFMPEYDERAELAPRDVVSQAIVQQMEKTQHACVYLDMSHLDAEHVRTRFPGILQACAKFGIDITRDRIPVRPGAHYMLGGVAVDLEGRTSMEGLWAGGEVTSSGLHGANRLASNSLLEGLVYGHKAGCAASAAAHGISRWSWPNGLDRMGDVPNLVDTPLDFDDIRNSLKSLMWRAVGVRRNQAGLVEASEAVRQWQFTLSRQRLADPAAWELQNLLDGGTIMIEAAVRREESRGVHFREDFPQPNPHWRQHLSYSLGQWKTEPVSEG
ncbi:MAG TPA: L-aspartate oxidase [Pirellulaceae bacterium]|nr:L-aspartate oxidase [Pirellulaceae bacterium]